MSVEDSSREMLEMKSFHTRFSAWTPFNNKSLNRQDCLWRPKCVKFGWFLPYTPAENEFGAWKHHYLSCVSHLDWLTPREAAAVYGTLNEPKAEDEELQARQREKCLRKVIWETIALRNKKLLRVRPPWVSGTRCSRLLKSQCHLQLSRSVKGRVGLRGALEKQLVLASLEALPSRSNVSGSHSYPLLSKKNCCGVYKKGDSSSALQLHLILISSRIPAYEMVVDSVKAGVVSVVYEHSGLTLDSLLHLTAKALGGRMAQSLGVLSGGDSTGIDLLQGYSIGISNVLRPEVRSFWEALGSSVAPADEGGHVDLFAPLAASEAGMDVLSQLSQLTGTLFTAPTGLAAGSYHHRQFLSDNVSVARILENQGTAQALADGLTALSRENCDNPLEFLSSFLLKKCSKKSKEVKGNGLPAQCGSKAASIAKTFDWMFLWRCDRSTVGRILHWIISMDMCPPPMSMGLD